MYRAFGKNQKYTSPAGCKMLVAISFCVQKSTGVTKKVSVPRASLFQTGKHNRKYDFGFNYFYSSKGKEVYINLESRNIPPYLIY